MYSRSLPLEIYLEDVMEEGFSALICAEKRRIRSLFLNLRFTHEDQDMLDRLEGLDLSSMERLELHWFAPRHSRFLNLVLRSKSDRFTLLLDISIKGGSLYHLLHQSMGKVTQLEISYRLFPIDRL
jgi:hypothetical protein